MNSKENNHLLLHPVPYLDVLFLAPLLLICLMAMFCTQLKKTQTLFIIQVDNKSYPCVAY